MFTAKQTRVKQEKPVKVLIRKIHRKVRVESYFVISHVILENNWRKK